MESYLCSIILFAGNFAPRGWAFCHGQILPIAQYSAIYALLGTTYGGDGISNFALPDLRNSTPLNAGSDSTLQYIICLEGIFPSRP